MLPGRARSTGWDRFWAPSSGPDVAGVDHRPGPVQLLRRPQPRQQDGMEPVPHSGLVPRGKTPPTRHAGTKAELLGQVLPLDAGVEHEQDPAQSLSVRNPRPARHQLRSRDRKQRLDQQPQFIGHDPRPRLPLPHEQTKRTSKPTVTPSTASVRTSNRNLQHPSSSHLCHTNYESRNHTCPPHIWLRPDCAMACSAGRTARHGPHWPG